MNPIRPAGVTGLLLVSVVAPLCSQAAVPERPAVHVRLIEDRGGTPIAMQTAVVRLQPPGATDGEGVVVDLVSAVHFGDRSYYRALDLRFRQYDAVLYELVAPEGSRVPRPDLAAPLQDPFGMLRKMGQAALGLESQLECIDYTRDNFVHADLSPRQMLQAMQARGEDGATLLLGVAADLLRQSNLEQRRAASGTRAPRPIETIDPFEELMQPGGATRLKRALAAELVQQAGGDGGLGRTIGAILVDDRNKAALSVLRKEIAKGRKRIAIFYGAAHMPDFERRLRAQFGLRRTGVEWLNAWNLTDESGTAFGGVMKMLADELSRELQPQSPRPRVRTPVEEPETPGTGASSKRRRRILQP